MVHGITKSRTRLSNLYYTHCDGGWDMWVSLPWQGNLFHIVLADFLLCECITFQLKKKKNPSLPHESRGRRAGGGVTWNATSHPHKAKLPHGISHTPSRASVVFLIYLIFILIKVVCGHIGQSRRKICRLTLQSSYLVISQGKAFFHS